MIVPYCSLYGSNPTSNILVNTHLKNSGNISSLNSCCSRYVMPTATGIALKNAHINMARLRDIRLPNQRLSMHIDNIKIVCTEPQTRPNLGTWCGNCNQRCLKLLLDTISSNILKQQPFRKSGMNSALAFMKHSIVDEVSQQTTLSVCSSYAIRMF